MYRCSFFCFSAYHLHEAVALADQFIRDFPKIKMNKQPPGVGMGLHFIQVLSTVHFDPVGWVECRLPDGWLSHWLKMPPHFTSDDRRQIITLEAAALNDPSALGPYRDWLIEKGWVERAKLLGTEE